MTLVEIFKISNQVGTVCTLQPLLLKCLTSWIYSGRKDNCSACRAGCLV